MFRMPVIEVPTNLPNIRKDLPIQAFAVCHLIASLASAVSKNHFPIAKVIILIKCTIFLLINYSRLLVGNGSKFAEKLNICLDKVGLS